MNHRSHSEAARDVRYFQFLVNLTTPSVIGLHITFQFLVNFFSLVLRAEWIELYQIC